MRNGQVREPDRVLAHLGVLREHFHGVPLTVTEVATAMHCTPHKAQITSTREGLKLAVERGLATVTNDRPVGFIPVPTDRCHRHHPRGTRRRSPIPRQDGREVSAVPPLPPPGHLRSNRRLGRPVPSRLRRWLRLPRPRPSRPPMDRTTTRRDTHMTRRPKRKRRPLPELNPEAVRRVEELSRSSRTRRITPALPTAVPWMRGKGKRR